VTLDPHTELACLRELARRGVEVRRADGALEAVLSTLEARGYLILGPQEQEDALRQTQADMARDEWLEDA
jgi:hypothetical protein